MKKILFTFLISGILIFSGCFGGDNEEKIPPSNSESTEIQPSKQLYETNDFSITIDKDWEIIEPNSFTSNVPKETIVGFRSNIKNEIFTANLNIVKFEITENINSQDLGKSTMAKAKQSLVNFQELQRENFTISKGKSEIETLIIDFEGKKSASEQIVHFKQLYVVDDGRAFIITAGYLTNEEESVVNVLEEMLKSFRLK